MRSAISILILFVSMVSFGQNRVSGEGATCSHCNMFVRNPLFEAEAVEKNGEVHKFDAIECLVNFLKERNEDDFSSLKVADHARNGEMIDARASFYLKSQKIPSPMGAYLSAYATRQSAERVQKSNGGDIYDWAELKERFKDSRFGLLGHPTHHHNHPDAFAPIGVMGDHLHHKGGFMFSIRYMTMTMDGNLQGTTEMANSGIFQNYMVAPQWMSMDMLMLGVMYAPSDKFTVMLMQNIITNSMDLSNMMGMNFSTKSDGLGDLRFSFLYSLLEKENNSLHFNSGISIPTGELDSRDDTPMIENMKLPYPMQPGTGTFDYTFGATYKGIINNLSWGIQQLNTIRTGENSEGYRLGNRFELNTWAAYRIAPWISISTRVQGYRTGEITGSDPDLNPMMAPPADPVNSGMDKIITLLGTNFSFGESPVFRDIKAGFEFGLPVYQKMGGIQMDHTNSLVAGIRYSF